MEINLLEYKMARRLQASEIQMQQWTKYEAGLKGKKNQRVGYNNLIRVADHIMFEDEDVDNYITSRGKPDAKRPHNGNSGK